MTHDIPSPARGAGPGLLHARDAARGPAGATLRLDLLWEDSVVGAREALAAAREAFTLAHLAGKTLHVGLGCRTTGGGGLSGNAVIYVVVCARADVLDAALNALELACSGPRIAGKTFAGLPEGATGEAVLEPDDAQFAEAVEALAA